jgi:hypothetical protein
MLRCSVHYGRTSDRRTSPLLFCERAVSRLSPRRCRSPVEVCDAASADACGLSDRSILGEPGACWFRATPQPPDLRPVRCLSPLFYLEPLRPTLGSGSSGGRSDRIAPYRPRLPAWRCDSDRGLPVLAHAIRAQCAHHARSRLRPSIDQRQGIRSRRTASLGRLTTWDFPHSVTPSCELGFRRGGSIGNEGRLRQEFGGEPSRPKI